MLFSRKSLFFNFFLAFACILLTHLPLWAENPKNNIMINTVGAVFGNYGPEYETAIGKHLGLGLRANIIPSWEANGGKNDTPGDDYDWIYSVSGYGAGLSLRYYPFTQAPGGFHFGPRFDYIAFSGTYEDRANNEEPSDTSLTLLTAHLEVGYKLIIAKRLVIGFFADGGYVSGESPDNSEWLKLAYIAGGGVYLGYAF